MSTLPDARQRAGALGRAWLGATSGDRDVAAPHHGGLRHADDVGKAQG